MKYWHLYVLIYNKKAIYIGVTNCINKRKSQHIASGKIFTSIKTIKKYQLKEDALLAENVLIRFNGMFDIGLQNAKHVSDVSFNQVWL